MDDIAVCLITIDNYDEVIKTMDEILGSTLQAQVDRRLHAMAGKARGILRRFDRDRYMYILTRGELDGMISGGFDIMKQVRETEAGNKMPMTLSIGAGVNGDSPAQNMEYAQKALDLALGRGGDQAVVRDGGGYRFFGGNIREKADTSRVRARVKAGVLRDLIDASSNVLVMGHRNPDLDCMGAALGVYRIARSRGRQCGILLNRVSDGVELLYERITGEGCGGVFVTSEGAKAAAGEGTLLIIVDCHTREILEDAGLLSLCGRYVVFDHHRKNAEYVADPVLAYHEPRASSTSELVTEMIQHLNVSLSELEADALLAGVTVDTKSFAFKTGANTFEAAAFLQRQGADSLRVRMLFKFDMKFYTARAAVVNNAEIVSGKYAFSECPPDTEKAALTAAQAADELLNISGIQAAFVLSDDGGQVTVSARSLGGVNVQRVMEELGGGGHQMAAGAQMPGVTAAEALELLKKALENINGR